jgi:hypothetical protein
VGLTNTLSARSNDRGVWVRRTATRKSLITDALIVDVLIAKVPMGTERRRCAFYDWMFAAR